MFDETNQTATDTSSAIDTSGEDFFDPIDFAEAGENPPTQEADDEGTSQPEAEPVADSETAAMPAGEENKGTGEAAKYPYKVNGEIKYASLDELTALAQMGEHYPTLRAELEALKKSPEIALLDEEAKKYGLTRPEYLAYIEKSRISEEIKAKYPEMPPEAVNEMAELQMQQKRSSNQEQSIKQQMEIERLKLKIMDEITQIKLANNLKEIPKEMLDAIAKGKTPAEAWEKYNYLQVQEKNKKLEAEIAALKQNEANRKASPPSAKDTQAAEQYDPFLAGLFGK